MKWEIEHEMRKVHEMRNRTWNEKHEMRNMKWEMRTRKKQENDK
jgi:hypothetical protein